MLHGMSSPIAPPGTVQERGGPNAAKEMNEYSRLLEEALQKGQMGLEIGNQEKIESALSCLFLPRYWAIFVKAVCDSFTKVISLTWPSNTHTYTVYSCIHCRVGFLKDVPCQFGKTLLLWNRNHLKPEIGKRNLSLICHLEFLCLGLNKNWCRGFLISQSKFYHFKTCISVLCNQRVSCKDGTYMSISLTLVYQVSDVTEQSDVRKTSGTTSKEVILALQTTMHPKLAIISSRWMLYQIICSC